MTATTILALGLGGLFTGLALALVTISAVTSERQQIGRSLAALRALDVTPASLRRDLDRPFGERVVLPVLDRLTRLGRRLTGADTTERLRKRLEYAGSPANWDADRVLAFKMLGLFGGAAVGFLVPVGLGLGYLVASGAAIALALICFLGPNLVLYQAGYNRMEKMKRELPNAIDLLTISVEAGLAFDAAMAQVARNTEGPLAGEFFRVLQEMQIGMGRMEAMRALADRTKIPELKNFVSAMVQADAFGIPIANVLRIQSKEMRVKRRQWAEEVAQKVPVKILFPLIFFVMPALFIVVLGPALLQMMEVFG